MLIFPCRGLHAAVYFSFTDCGSSLVLYGAGRRPEYSAGEHRCVETHLPETGGDWLLQLCGESFQFMHFFSFFFFLPI